MNTFTDLNQVLPTLISEGSMQDIERLVASSLSAKTVFAALKQSKRYETIGVFLPLLDLEHDEYLCEDFDRLFAQAIVEGNTEGIAQLNLHLKKYLNHKNIAFHYGQLATSSEPPIACEKQYTKMIEYQEGLVAVDNLDLLLLCEFIDVEHVCLTAGTYCAKRAMNHFGYHENNLKNYLKAAFLAKSLDTFYYLLEAVPSKEHFLAEVKKVAIKDMRFLSRKCVDVISWLLKESYLSFTKEEWEKIKKDFPLLYAKLQEDV